MRLSRDSVCARVRVRVRVCENGAVTARVCVCAFVSVSLCVRVCAQNRRTIQQMSGV